MLVPRNRLFLRAGCALVVGAVLVGCATNDLSAAALVEGAGSQASVVVRPLRSEAGYTSLEYEIEFVGDDDGSTTLTLPDTWGGTAGLWQSIKDLVAEGGELRPGPTPATAFIDHRPSAPIKLKYRVVQVQAGEPQAGRANEYRPVIQSRYFQVFGATAFIGVEHLQPTATVVVTLEATSGGSLASDLQHNGGRVAWEDLFESTIVGGDFRILGSSQGLRVAVRGEWPRTDAAWGELVERVSAAQAAYWREPNRPFLVTILPVGGGSGTTVVGGTGLGDAFAFFATTNAPPDIVDEVLSHEKTHTWIPGLLGQVTDEQASSQELAWIVEGFTDWVSWRGLNRSRAWTNERLLAKVNQGLREYDVSALRNAPNVQTAPLFHRDPEAQRHPYRKGMLIALRWNALILQATQGRASLDDVLIAMRRHAANHPDSDLIGNLVQRTREISGVDISADLRDVVAGGSTVELPSDLLGPCIRVETVVQPVFERGYDPVATQSAGNIVTGLDPSSRAYAAGLRNGMRLVRRMSGVTGDATQPWRFEVESGGRTTEVSWLPQGAKSESFRRLDFAQTDTPSCSAPFG